MYRKAAIQHLVKGEVKVQSIAEQKLSYGEPSADDDSHRHDLVLRFLILLRLLHHYAFSYSITNPLSPNL